MHRVSVGRFWMGVTEVTQAQWQAVMGSNPSHFKQAGPDAPVEMVTWNDVQEFIRKLNAREADRRYRLPSEAEWEWACKGGGGPDPYGRPEDIAWIQENSGGTTHPVGQKRPNAFGLHDMFGNVSEWCEDTSSTATTGHRSTAARARAIPPPATRCAEGAGTCPPSSSARRCEVRATRFTGWGSAWSAWPSPRADRAQDGDAAPAPERQDAGVRPMGHGHSSMTVEEAAA